MPQSFSHLTQHLCQVWAKLVIWAVSPPAWFLMDTFLITLICGMCSYKQLLDVVFVISRIIKVKVRVISRSWFTCSGWWPLPRPGLFWISQKTKSNKFVLLYIEWKWKSCFCFFTDGKQHKVCELDMITCDRACPWHDYCIICSYDVTGTDFENSLYAFGQSEKS